MANCDICGGMTAWGTGTTYTADEFRMIVAMGFRPDRKVVMMGPAAVQGWINGLVASSTTGWLLCPSCAVRAAQYMPKTTGTGPAGQKLEETMTVDQLLGSSLLKSLSADVKPEGKTPSSTPKKPEIPQAAYHWTAVTGDDKECPECAETIKTEARICRFCEAKFDVEVRGYCDTDHDEVTLDDKDRCSLCGGEVVDRHIKTRLKVEAPLVEAQAGQVLSISPATTAPGISRAEISFRSVPQRLDRPGCLTAYAIFLIMTSLIILLGGTCGGFSMLTTGTEVVGGAVSFVVSLVMGVLGLLLARGLWLMKNWARIGVILTQGAGMIIGLLTILSLLFPLSTTEGVEMNPSGIIFGGIVGLIIPGVILVWFMRNGKDFQEPVQLVVAPSPQASSPIVSRAPETPPAQTKPPEIIPATSKPSATSWESVLSGKQPDAPSPPVPETSRLVAEALEIIESRVVQFIPGGVIKSGGDTSEAMNAAEKLAEAHQLQPEDPWLHYAWASALHLAMQYKTGREEMERLAQTHPDFLFAKFAIDDWDQWDGLFALPPWKPGIENVHPAISAEIKAAFVLGTRQELQPRATLFLRDAGGDFQNPSILQNARIDITTVLSSDDPQIAVLYARIWDNPDSPYQVEALGLPLYPRGSKLRCKYEYLCLQEDIDFAVIDNHDRILLNKRLAFPKRMRKTHEKLLKLLQSSPGREISDTELVSAVRSFQSRFSLSDVRY